MGGAVGGAVGGGVGGGVAVHAALHAACVCVPLLLSTHVPVVGLQLYTRLQEMEVSQASNSIVPLGSAVHAFGVLGGEQLYITGVGDGVGLHCATS